MFKIFSFITFEIAKSQREKKQKKNIIRDNFFHFQNFRAFGNLDFG